MNHEAQLRRAEEHIFSTALLDSGSRLGLANMRYGLAKIHWVQEQLGLPPNATFVSAPDCTVTRNRQRWKSGFGYGGILTWGEGNEDLMILDVKPNACGMIVGGLSRAPRKQELIERVHELSHEEVEIDGVTLEWDFARSNHFIDIFRIEPLTAEDLPPYAFMMHFAGDELRGETRFGPGLYWHDSPTLQEQMQVFETPFGPLRVLTGSAARGYYDFYEYVDHFVRKRREYVADRLFDEYTLINNDTHQGLKHPNQLLLGCYSFDDLDRLYAIGLRPDLPAYLVRGKPNLNPETIESLGFEKRAQRLEVYDRLTSANVLPHGGGYVFPDILGVSAVHEIDGERYYEVDFKVGGGRAVISGVRDLPYEYRGRSVVLRTVEVGLADLVARLEPEYVLKV